MQAKSLTLCPYLESAAGQCPLHNCAYAHSEEELAQRKAARAAKRQAQQQPQEHEQQRPDSSAAAGCALAALPAPDDVAEVGPLHDEVGPVPASMHVFVSFKTDSTRRGACETAMHGAANIIPILVDTCNGRCSTTTVQSSEQTRQRLLRCRCHRCTCLPHATAVPSSTRHLTSLHSATRCWKSLRGEPQSVGQLLYMLLTPP